MRAALTSEQFEAEAAHRMEGFAFASLGRTPEFEGWRCMKPGTGIFAFDLVLTRNGIAMFGDVDGLLFNVGTPAYGIGWLTHHDIGYIHSKLEQQCKETELDREALKGYVAEWLCQQISKDPIELPAFLEDDNHFDRHWDDLRAYLQDSDDYGAERDFMDEILEVQGVDAAYKMLDDEEGIEGILGEDLGLCEVHISKPTEDLTQRLYMVRRAARAILEIKQREAA